MQSLIQLVLGCTLLGLLIMWSNWVWDSVRPIKSPEFLGQIVVYGPDAASADNIARAMGIGFVAALAKHKRDVNLINQVINQAVTQATTTDGRPNIVTAMTLSTRAPPELLRVAETPVDIDMKLEFAGAAVDAKGLSALFRSQQPRRGALELAVLYDQSVEGEAPRGAANAQFREDSNFSFSIEFQGQVPQVAEQIAMRYIQSIYARDEEVLHALDPKDFRTFWEVRREAANIARLASLEGSNTISTDTAARATDALNRIKPLTRYRQWIDVQRLCGYIASVAGESSLSIECLKNAQTATPDNGEKEKLGNLVIALNTSQAGQAIATSEVMEVAEAAKDLEKAVRNQPELRKIDFLTLRSRALTANREVKVAVLLGPHSVFPQFPTHFPPKLNVTKDEKYFDLRNHTNGVVGLIAALAPTAKIKSVTVLEPNFSGLDINVLQALESIVSWKPDIIHIGIGPLNGNIYRDVLEKIDALNGNKTMIVLPIGNSGQVVTTPYSDLDFILYVGSTSGNARAAYSSFSDSENLIYAPGTVLTYRTPAELITLSGSSLSATVTTAVAANLLATMPQNASAADLRTAIKAYTHQGRGIRILGKK